MNSKAISMKIPFPAAITLPNNSPVESTVKFFKKNPAARVILLILILFAATYGSVEVLRIIVHTESPLMVVSSESMVPTLNVGDIIFVRGANASSITTGTIIIFHSPYDYQMPIVHRVLAISNDGNSLFFQTKGDNNPAPDGWRVPAKNLMGVYVVKLPYVGLISLELRGPLGVTLIIILITLIVAIEYSESRSSKRKSKS
jgi:signal peptidase